jgi:hypothetical protein
MSAELELDERIPPDAVLRAAYGFLESAGWELEFDGDGSIVGQTSDAESLGR